MKKVRLLTSFFLLWLSSSVFAFEPFYIKSIEVTGNKRVSKAAVLQSLPVSVGSKLYPKQTSEIIAAIYSTKFFDDISLENNLGTLVIKLTEKPSIGEFNLKGIKSKKSDIEKILQEHDIVEGRIYDKYALQQVEEEVLKYYIMKGHYGVKVSSKIDNLEDNRVAVNLSVYEGDEARIKRINIIGNNKFTDKELIKQMYHKTTNWKSWFSKDDRYFKEKFLADQEVIQSYYMDRGYIDVQINSAQVALHPDKKQVYLTINLEEGQQYLFNESDISGNFSVPKEELQQILKKYIVKNKVFSRKILLETKEALLERLGQDGYSKADIRFNLIRNDLAKTININFYIDSKHRVLVRYINFLGNNLTEDRVLRRTLPQLESTWITTKYLEKGKEAMLREGFASQVEIETKPVDQRNDLIDIDYKVTEQRTAQVQAGIAYSQADKFIINFGADFKNFFGTGKDVNLSLDRGKTYNSYNLGYYNPYFTEDGIGFGYNIYYQKTELSKVSNIFDYTTNSYGGDLHWSFRVSEYNSVSVGFGYDKTDLKFNSSQNTPVEISDFIAKEGTNYKEYLLILGWRHNSLDKFIFPTKGLKHGLNLRISMPASKLKYYRLDYDLSWFKPITSKYIFNINGNLGYAKNYGSTFRYPFFKHYFLGGAESLRGFEERSIGPKDSLDNNFGGNLLVNFQFSLIFPPPFISEPKSVRTAVFLDAGQLYDTINRYRTVNGSQVSRNSNGLRYSAGLSLTWDSPLGVPMVFSLAKPIKSKPGDKKEFFAFTFGTRFL